MQPQPLLVVSDVEATARWLSDVFELTSGHGGAEYDAIMNGDTVVAQLHVWDAHGHEQLGDPTIASRGNGVLIWFETGGARYDRILENVRTHSVEILDGPLTKPNSGLREVWLRGPEGYRFVVAAP